MNLFSDKREDTVESDVGGNDVVVACSHQKGCW
jgi:hypothetical protein